MNHDDDFIAQLEDYLDTFDGVVPLPMSVRTEVQARPPVTRQVRGARGSETMTRMISRMSTPARRAMGVAAVLAVMVLWRYGVQPRRDVAGCRDRRDAGGVTHRRSVTVTLATGQSHPAG